VEYATVKPGYDKDDRGKIVFQYACQPAARAWRLAGWARLIIRAERTVE
jgi:hypothetical protein